MGPASEVPYEALPCWEASIETPWFGAPLTQDCTRPVMSIDARAPFTTQSAVTAQPASIDTTGLVQSWVSGAPNHGVSIEASQQGRASYGTSDAGPINSRPQLVVCYV